MEVKEAESITFPPTQKPTILPASAPKTTGEVTPDPFDQYYEDYDTEDLPPLDLDLPRLGQGQGVPTAAVAAPERPKQVSSGWCFFFILHVRLMADKVTSSDEE